MKYCYLHEHLHHHHHFKRSLRLFSLHLPIVTSNHSCDFQLFLYYAREYSELFSLKLQPIILKIMPAY